MHDYDIRILLSDFLRNKFVLSDPDCLIIDEFGLCQGSARIDMAVINGHLHGYEIKSEHDTLYRMDSQLDVYSRTMDYLTFVTNEKHLAPLAAKLPGWCGLTLVDASGLLHEIRPAEKNANIDPASLVQLLWRDETIAILRRLGHERGLNQPRKALWEKVVESLDLEELNAEVRHTLKARDAWRVVRSRTQDGGSLLQTAK